MPGEATPNHLRALVMLFGGAVGLLLAVLVVARTLFDDDDAAPGRRALAHWLPIATAAALFAALRHPEMAMGIAFGTSVALLSTVVGFVVMPLPLDEVPARHRPLWFLVPVAAALAFLCGFRGALGYAEALTLLIQGGLLWTVWTHQPAAAVPPPAPVPGVVVRGVTPLSFWVIAITVAGLGVAAVAAWAATRGAVNVATVAPHFPTGLAAATVLSLALITPMISTGVPPASRGDCASPLTAQIGVVLLNLCATLPIIVVVSVVRRWADTPRLAELVESGRLDETAGWTDVLRAWADTRSLAPLNDPTVHFPLAVWRIDAIALIILSLLLVPVAAGRVKLDRWIGGGLIFAYCIYLIATVRFGGGR